MRLSDYVLVPKIALDRAMLDAQIKMLQESSNYCSNQEIECLEGILNLLINIKRELIK